MERSPELEDLTRRLYAAVAGAEAGFFERYLSRSESSVVIGTAPGEWWDDAASALKAIKQQMSSVGAAASLVPGDLCAYRHGDVGWVSDRPVFSLAGVDVECRHTSVFVREGSDWQIVQHHFSIGMPNEQVFGDAASQLGQ